MISKRNVFIFLAASSLILFVAAANNPDFYINNFNMNLLNLMARSSDAIAVNPRNASKCFGYYNPIINGIIQKYERDYDACCKSADDEHKIIDLDTLASRESLANKTEDSCAALSKCKNLDLVKEEYECYIDGGNDSSKVMHGISNDAFSSLAEYKEKTRVIQYNKDQCTNKTRECFEEESYKAYVELNNCLTGISGVPTSDPIVSKSSTTEVTTKESL